MPCKPHDDAGEIGTTFKVLGRALWWMLATLAFFLLVGTLIWLSACTQHPATPPPFPHKGDTTQYNLNDPRLVLVAEDYLIYKR